MKKKLSVLLILTLLVTTLVPFSAFAEQADQDIFNTLTSNILYDKLMNMSLDDLDAIASTLEILDSKDIVAGDIEAVLNTGNGELKQRLINSGIAMDAITAALITLEGMNQEDLSKSDPALGGQGDTLDPETEGIIYELRTQIRDTFPVANDKLNTNMKDPNQKFAMILDLINIFFDYSYVQIEMDEDGYFVVNRDMNKMVNDINTNIITKYFNNIQPLTSNEKTTLDAFYQKIEDRLNSEIYDDVYYEDEEGTIYEYDMIYAALKAVGLSSKTPDEINENLEEIFQNIDNQSADEAVGTVTILNQEVEKVLGNPESTAEEVSDVLKNVVDTTAKTIDKPDLTLDAAKQVIQNAVENTAAVAAADQKGLVSEDVKDKLADAVGKVVSKAGIISDAAFATTSTTATVTVDTGKVSAAKANALATANEMTQTLNSAGLNDVASQVEKIIKVEVPAAVNEKAEAKVSIPNGALKDLATDHVDVSLAIKGVEFKVPSQLIENSDEGLNIEVSNKDLTAAKKTEVENKATEVENGIFFMTDALFDLDMKTKDAQGTENKITNFKTKPVVEISLDGVDLLGVDINRLGVYAYNETTKAWEYVKTTYNKVNNSLVFQPPHFSIYGVLEYYVTFTDVTAAWAKDKIEIMAAKHIAAGVGDNEFAPNNKITRAEFSALLVRTLGIKGTGKASFTDVSKKAWYANEVALAADNGIVSGMGDGKFAPTAPITREQMAKMIANTYQVMKGRALTSNTTSFKDKSTIGSWALGSVAGANYVGIINGYPDGTFKPKNNATRAEGIVMIYQLLEQ